MNWQPIETAPKDGTKIIIYGTYQWENYADRQETGTAVVQWLEDDRDEPGRWCLIGTNPYVDYAQPTHWMPLPEPPCET